MKKKSPVTGKLPAKDASKIGSRKGKRIIRKHHTLLKEKAKLEKQLSQGIDVSKELDQVKQDLTGDSLDRYQRASIAGQDPTRGGDSSKVLIEWADLKDKSVLEVGSLRIDNAVAGACKAIDRLDLNPQHDGIQKQDFMERSPSLYDCVSLSLVVNFVPDAATRGAMLRHSTRFLHPNGLLFLVLPAPCVTNSRYFTEERLDCILKSLGYVQLQRKVTPRIAYWLYRYTGKKDNKKYKKNLLNDGKVRNNFTITLL